MFDPAAGCGSTFSDSRYGCHAPDLDAVGRALGAPADLVRAWTACHYDPAAAYAEGEALAAE